MTTPAAMWQTTSPEQILKERFHITTGFHPGQRDIIEQLVMGKRLLVIQRTGWGKSVEICTAIVPIFLEPHSSRSEYTQNVEQKTGELLLSNHKLAGLIAPVNLAFWCKYDKL